MQYKIYKLFFKNVNVYYQRLPTFVIFFIINDFISVYWYFLDVSHIYKLCRMMLHAIIYKLCSFLINVLHVQRRYPNL